MITDAAGNTFETTTDADGNFTVEGSSDQILALGVATITGTFDGNQITTTVDVVKGDTTVGALTTVGRSTSTAANEPAPDQPATAQATSNQAAANQSTANPPAKLALTGNQTRTHVALALLLLAVGTAMIITRRRYVGQANS